MTMADTIFDALMGEVAGSIACEWPDCSTPAVVMGKGCTDEHHVAVCAWHHEWIQRWFEGVHPQVPCNACRKPMLVFDDHFDIRPLQ